MTINFIQRLLAVCLLALPVLFSACVRDTCKNEYSYSYFMPVYKTKDEVRANIRSAEPREIKEPGKIYVLGNYIFLNEINKGIHVIDNTNPSDPRNISFIDIPGNLDLAAKGNTLYADMYTDVVALNIQDPLHISLQKAINGVFPFRYYGNGFTADNDKVIIDWIKRDTTVVMPCYNDEPIIMYDVVMQTSGNSGIAFNSASASPIGVGGSMARFTLASDRLYAVSESSLEVINITEASNPSYVGSFNLGWGIETIYPLRDKLFIGSQSGMFVYDISNPDQPLQTGTFNHVRTCDPVIADENYAYVTLRSGSTCAGYTNQLDIISLENLGGQGQQALVKTYELNNPHGLSKNGDILYICDGISGLRIYNAANVTSLQLLSTVPDHDAFDVISQGSRIIVTGKDGLYQYNVTDPAHPVLLSRFILPVK